ncbi:hypothetical protein OQA88_7631 [Cercophora sp. LCS_1]
MPFPSITSIYTQFFPPPSSLTESTLPPQTDKTFLITGASSGIGYELARILYGAGGTVYILTRSEPNALSAIARIKALYDSNRPPCHQAGELHYIHCDLADLESVRSAATQFLEQVGKDGRLDVLFNNAGVGALKGAGLTKQGHEHHFGTNLLGGFLLTKLLRGILRRTAAREKPGAVRVVWPASCMVDMGTPEGGIRKGFLDGTVTVKNPNELYSSSKAGCWFVAAEGARRYGTEDGVVHVAGNPGNYVTNIWRDTPAWLFWLVRPILRDQVHGAETYLWMGFAKEVTLEEAENGRYAICDGRWHPGQRADLLLAVRSVEDGGSGRARQCWEWCEERTKEYTLE